MVNDEIYSNVLGIYKVLRIEIVVAQRNNAMIAPKRIIC